MSEAIEILEDVIQDCDALKQKCLDSIRKIKAKEGFYSPSTRKGPKQLNAYQKRRKKLQNQSS